MNVRLLSVMVSAFALGSSAAGGGGPGVERELIQDNHFQRGFILWQPKPGRHVRYGELRGGETNRPPVWGLAQWSSRFPLEPAAAQILPGGALICSNAAKAVTLGAANPSAADLVFAVNSREEYGPRARPPAEPWVHLLAEQEFGESASLAKLRAAKLHVEARLLRARNRHADDYSPDRHAAQFQIFFTLQNANRQSPGYGDLLWFGVPIYDNRDRFPKAFKAQDFGGTAKFIFTPAGDTYAAVSAHDGKWITLEKDLLPLLREALTTAWARGFLKDSKELADYRLGGMNLGWECPGSFDVEMQLRNLSLKLVAVGE